MKKWKMDLLFSSSLFRLFLSKPTRQSPPSSSSFLSSLSLRASVSLCVEAEGPRDGYEGSMNAIEFSVVVLFNICCSLVYIYDSVI